MCIVKRTITLLMFIAVAASIAFAQANAKGIPRVVAALQPWGNG
jgi:hypothetical protein